MTDTRSQDECYCECHLSMHGIMHDGPCCTPCPFCCRNIRGMLENHVQTCYSRVAAPQEPPSSTRSRIPSDFPVADGEHFHTELAALMRRNIF